MDAYHAVQRGEEPPEHADDGSRVPEPEKAEADPADATAAANAVLARIALAEGVDRQDLPAPAVGRVDPSIGRAELIRKAMAVHKAKQSVLAGLDDQTREKLHAMALQAFFNEKPKHRGK